MKEHTSIKSYYTDEELKQSYRDRLVVIYYSKKRKVGYDTLIGEIIGFDDLIIYLKRRNGRITKLDRSRVAVIIKLVGGGYRWNT